MKNRFLATLSSLTLLTAAAAFAQGGPAMQADIPFAFHIGTTVLPAGHYELNNHVVQGTLLIRCRECKAAALILVNRTDGGKTEGSAKLVFNRYGKTRFLSGIWIPEYSVGKELSKSKTELEFARNSSPDAPTAIALARR